MSLAALVLAYEHRMQPLISYTNSYVKSQICMTIFNSLTAIDGHDRQYFNELRSTVVSRRIFIRSQSLIAR